MICFEAYFELSRLNVEYWACADKRTSTAASELFTKDGRLVLGTLELVGHQAIDRFFAERERKNTESGRITRHMATGFQIVSALRNRWEARSVVAVFAGSGQVPIASDVPATIADVSDVFVQHGDGAILLERRVIKPTFVGAAAASFAR